MRHRWLVTLVAGSVATILPFALEGESLSWAWLAWEMSPVVLLALLGFLLTRTIWVASLVLAAVIAGGGEVVALTNGSSTSSLLLITLPVLSVVVLLALALVDVGTGAVRTVRSFRDGGE